MYFYLDSKLGSQGNPDLPDVCLVTKWNYWILVVTVPLNYMDGVIVVDPDAVEDTLRVLQDVVRLELQWPFSFVVLTLSRSEKARWWLLLWPEALRYFFCGSCENELEGLALVAWGQKSVFPHWLTLLLSHILAWSHSRDILAVVCPFMTHHFYCGQDCTQQCVLAHVNGCFP